MFAYCGFWADNSSIFGISVPKYWSTREDTWICNQTMQAIGNQIARRRDRAAENPGDLKFKCTNYIVQGEVVNFSGDCIQAESFVETIRLGQGQLARNVQPFTAVKSASVQLRISGGVNRPVTLYNESGALAVWTPTLFKMGKQLAARPGTRSDPGPQGTWIVLVAGVFKSWGLDTFRDAPDLVTL